MPSLSVGGYVSNDDALYGLELRKAVRRKYGSFIFLTGEGEMIPNKDSFCELNPAAPDQWGFPTLRFHWKWGESEVRQAEHMRSTFESVFHLVGGAVVGSVDTTMPAGGSAIHEVGGARMGVRPEDSVVDRFGKCWGAENVFVLDGSVFASSPDKNPTLTILALAARGAHKIVELFRSRAIMAS
jgi:choline dehydrogenase-like flavoprotein